MFSEIFTSNMGCKFCFVSFVHFSVAAIAWQILGYVLPDFILSYYYCTANTVIFLLTATFAFSVTRKKILDDRIESNQSVFITGCDSGFGHNLAKRLDSKGFHVFAGCLFPSGAGATALREQCSTRLQILEVDVTKDESVNHAVEFVKNNWKTPGLWAIVNNAGISKGFYVEVSSMTEFKDTMEVNAFGPVRVTKAFLPLLKQTKGRVVNVTSLIGKSSMPGVTPYVMSKYAAVAFNDCLKHEIESYGIRVISIEPEIFRTGLTNRENMVKQLEQTYGAEQTVVNAHKVGDDIKGNVLKEVDFVLSFSCPNIKLVVDDLESAISDLYPESTYRPRRNMFVRLLLFVYELMSTDLQVLISKCFRKFISAFY